MNSRMDYRIIKTKDGGETIWDPLYQQTYKSSHAAEIETETVFFQPAVLQNPFLTTLNGKSFKILEIGFGLGSNFLTTVRLLKEYKDIHWDYLAVDKSKDALRFKLNNKTDPLLDEILLNNKVEFPNGSVKLVLSTFHTFLSELAQNGDFFHAIYFDPFSPKVNPEAWDDKIFSLCAKILVPGGRLATYSVSKEAKNGLLNAGFKIQKLKPPAILQKKSTLLAIK